MKTIRELREAALNEARKNKWTDNDPYWSKNTNGRVAAKGKIKLDVTELWEHAEPFKKFKDNKAIANTGKGDQNKRQHAFWEKRYDIKITGEHFDASAKNERGAVVPRVYNIMGLPLDIEINKKMKKVKIIAKGDLTAALTIAADVNVTKGARAAIEAAGGKVEE